LTVTVGFVYFAVRNMTLFISLFCFGCFAAISYGKRDQCVWDTDVCINMTHSMSVPNSMRCECWGTTLLCVQSYQTEQCDQTDKDLINAFDQPRSPCCETPSTPATTALTGCCIGTTSKCDTDDKVVCDRASTCEWEYDATKCDDDTQHGSKGSSSERGSAGRGSSDKSSSGRGSSGSRSSSSSSDRRGPGSEQSLFADVSMDEKQEMSGMDVLLLAVCAVTFMVAAHQLYRWCSGSEYKALPEMSQSQPLLGAEV